jgi:hypothetical protein
MFTETVRGKTIGEVSRHVDVHYDYVLYHDDREYERRPWAMDMWVPAAWSDQDVVQHLLSTELRPRYIGSIAWICENVTVVPPEV